MTYRPVTWTAALRAACQEIAENGSTADLRSRADEIARGARPGAILTPMNVEFVSAMRSRFGCGGIVASEAEQAFDARWATAWADAA